MCSTGRSISQTRPYDIHRHSTVASSYIRQSVQFETTFHGDKPTRIAHINNLYNTTFWALVQKGGQNTTEAHATLRGTVSATKHEMLFSRFGINYNEISQRFKKGSVIVREIVALGSSNKDEYIEPAIPLTCSGVKRGRDESPERPGASDPLTNIPSHSQYVNEGDETPPLDPPRKKRSKAKKKNKLETTVEVLHCDIIGDEFWLARPHLLEN